MIINSWTFWCGECWAIKTTAELVIYRDYHIRAVTTARACQNFCCTKGLEDCYRPPDGMQLHDRSTSPHLQRFANLLEQFVGAYFLGVIITSKTSCVVYDHRTPVHAAAFNDQVECLQLLLSRGGNVDSVDQSGRTPLIMAADNGHAGAVGEPSAQVIFLSH